MKQSKNSALQIYLAAPLFTDAERTWNLKLADALKSIGYNVIVPQISANEFVGNGTDINHRAIFIRAMEDIKESDIILSIIDGPDVDSGVAWECGFAYANKKDIYSLRTDFRKGGDGILEANLMISESSKDVAEVSALENDFQEIILQLGAMLP